MSRAALKSQRKAKGRLEAFSDGVFAIAITLLILEIAVKEAEPGKLFYALFSADTRPMYLAYFIAFMTIGIAWIEHSALTEGLDYVDAGFQRLNLLLLLLVAFLPFPTATMAEYMKWSHHNHTDARTAVVFFGVVLFLISLMLMILAKYAEREGLFGEDIAEERVEENRIKYQLAPSLIFYGIAIVCGFVVPYLGLAMYVLIGVFLILPIRSVRRLLGKKNAGADADA